MNNSLSSSPTLFPLEHPAIGIPSHPLQYRAIGVVKGIYKPEEGVLTKGVLITEDNYSFSAVLLGKTICAVRKHINLEEAQLWVVYPHSLPGKDELHFQIAGIYKPHQPQNPPLPENYFSIRGEVVYSSKSREKVVVKIYHNNYPLRKGAPCFKVELKGKIPNNRLKSFFTFSARLEGKYLVIQEYFNLGLMAAYVK